MVSHTFSIFYLFTNSLNNIFAVLDWSLGALLLGLIMTLFLENIVAHLLLHLLTLLLHAGLALLLVDSLTHLLHTSRTLSLR